MTDVPPPGRLAQALGANAVATCTCGSNIFYPLVKLLEGVMDNSLVAIKCVACNEETAVPLDPKREQEINPFDRKLSKEMDRMRKEKAN